MHDVIKCYTDDKRHKCSRPEIFFFFHLKSFEQE